MNENGLLNGVENAVEGAANVAKFGTAKKVIIAVTAFAAVTTGIFFLVKGIKKAKKAKAEVAESTETEEK